MALQHKLAHGDLEPTAGYPMLEVVQKIHPQLSFLLPSPQHETLHFTWQPL
jgi:hypothetical protein